MIENSRPIKQPTLEFLVYMVIFMVAGAFRFMLLGNLPLDDHEAHLALQALQWSRGDPPLLAGEPGYISLTTILFFIFSATEFSARFWPALAGTLVVLVPVLYRRWLGRFTALVLAVLLAIDPILIGVSRSAEGSTLALLGLLAAIGFGYRKHPLLSGISLGVAVLGGIGFWPGFIVLGGLVLVYMKTDGRKGSEEGFTLPSGRSLLPIAVAGLITVVVVSTLLLTNPRGISAIGSAFADYARSWSVQDGSPVLGVKIAWILSLLPMMVFAIWSFIEGLIHRDKRVKWLGIWAATALLLALVNPSRQLFDLFWVSIPLLSLAAIKLAALFSNFEVESRIVYLAEAGLVVALVVFSFLNAIYLVNNPLLNQEEYRNRVIGMILPLILLIGMTALLAWGWSVSSTRKGFLTGVVILAIFTVLSGTWKAAGMGNQPQSEIRRSVGIPVGAEELLSTIEDISRTKTGIENRIDIQLIDLDLPSINWVLRDFEQTADETLFNPNLASSIILTPIDLEIEASASYRGQKVLWQVAPDIDNLNFTDWMRWSLFRTAPTKKTEIILWARNDLFPGSTTP